MTNIQITNQTFIDPLQPRDYEKIRSSTLYQSQFKPDLEKVAKDYLATMMAPLMESFSAILMEEGMEGLAFLKEETNLMLGRLMVNTGQFKATLGPLVNALEESRTRHESTEKSPTMVMRI